MLFGIGQPFLRTLLLYSVLWLGTAQALLAQTPLPSHRCTELQTDRFRGALESCGAHASCEQVLSQLPTCQEAVPFLTRLEQLIAERPTIIFFKPDPRAAVPEVWASLASLIDHPALKDAKWRVELEQLDGQVFKKNDVAQGVDALTGTWIFWGAVKDGVPAGYGVIFEKNGPTFRLARGNFEGRYAVGFAEVIKFDGKLLSRQLGVFNNERLRGNVETLTVSANGLLMSGKFDDSLTLFDGLIEQPDKSKIQGKYHLQTGDGDRVMFRPDGSIKERGQYKAHQLFVGERLDENGKVVEQVNLQRVQEEQERAKQQLANQARAKLEDEQQARRKKEEADLRLRLEQWHAGQIFAFADEARDDGRINEARLAWRALLRRFPDHGLAPQAADMLGKTAGSATSRPDGEPAGASAQGALSQAKCEELLSALDKEQQLKSQSNTGLAPFALHRQYMGFVNERLLVLDKKCSPNIRNQLQKEQLVKAFNEAASACKKIVVDEQLCSPQ